MAKAGRPVGSVEPFAVSQSKIKTWLQCRQKYHYKYIEFLKKKKVKRPFQFGRIVHKMIEKFAEGDDPFETLEQIDIQNANMFRAEKEQYGEIIEDIEVIMKEYFDYWGEDSVRYSRIKGKSSEHDFEVPLTHGIVAKGRIDSVAKAKGLRWLVEHKTFSRMPTEDSRWRSLQSASYHRFATMMGWKPLDGTLWDYIWSKPPGRPEILQSGQMSLRSNLVSLPEMIRRVIKKNNLREPYYADYIKAQEANRSRYFDRVFMPIDNRTIDALFGDYIEVAVEMRHLAGKSKRRTIAFHCNGCEYEPLCRADLQGSDVGFVKQREYIIDEKDYQDDLLAEE